MNKKVGIGIGIGLIFIAAIFVVLFIVIPKSEEGGSDTLELTYQTNGGVPYEWKYEIKDPSIVEFVEKKDITPDEYKDLAGGPVYLNYVFKGLKKGTTTITFKYVNFVDGSVDKEETVTVKVDGNKKISLVGNLKK